MPVDLHIAESLAHALELLSAGDPDVRPVAGATDVVLRLHGGKLKARALVSIADLPELTYIRSEEEHVCFGAGTFRQRGRRVDRPATSGQNVQKS